MKPTDATALCQGRRSPVECLPAVLLSSFLLHGLAGCTGQDLSPPHANYLG